ncbi:MAG: sulfatase-like hydrolase/transferase [Niameybacter sp.]
MNFILIFADQMHKYAFGKRNSEILTPHLDQLCEEGVLFRNGYSNNPICGPYRGTLFTGLYTSHNHVSYNGQGLYPDTPSLASQLNSLGYETSFIGKWHLGGDGNDSIPASLQGDFKYFMGYQCYNGFLKDVIFWNGQGEKLEFNQHRTEVTTDLALQNLSVLKQTGKPFFQVIGYQAPHYPEQPLPEYAKIYSGKSVKHTPDYIEVDPYTPTFSPYSPRPFEDCADYQRYGNNMDEYIRLYNAMITQIDHGVGKILEEIRKLGLEEETLVIFTSDHGDMQGSHGLKNKCLPYEMSCGVPFIVKDPKGLKNTVSDVLISGVDIYPSLLDYAGTKSVHAVDGKSFKPYLRQAEETINPFIIAEYIDPESGWQMIRDNQFKLCIHTRNRVPYLFFDLLHDPYELVNLVDQPTYESVKEKLLAQINVALLSPTSI